MPRDDVRAPLFYGHVVFPDLQGDGLRAINFSPQTSTADFEQAIPLSEEEDICLRWLFRQGGLDARHYRAEVLKRRIPAVLRALRVRTLREARSIIGRNPRLASEAIESLVIGVTHFFRDPEVFQILREKVLPDLAGPGGRAMIWSVGCSDGAELYSFALMLAEQGVLHRRFLLGTDCRPPAVARAAVGNFEQESLRLVPEPLLRRYFHQQAGSWQVTPWLRQQLHWRTADVLALREPGPWDLILCRNLSIYLQPQAAAILWSRLREALRPGGILMTGKAERPPTGFGFTCIGPSLYRRDRS